MGQKELNEIINKHKLWLDNQKGGELANLEGANLVGANLYKANLYEANLIGANLIGANLEGANLYGTNVITFQSGKHFAFYHEGIVKIGCKSMKVEEWISKYKEIGQDQGYTKEQVENYGMFLLLLKTRQNNS